MLCAYLEGELSPAQRVEIEKHLAANPQHRQLLSELARTRDWLRAVPRELSPVDLGEVFQGQVERAMLLDGSPEESAAMALNRWPQYILVAAVTVLTLGLGAVLVAVLRTPANNGTAILHGKDNSTGITAPSNVPTGTSPGVFARDSASPATAPTALMQPPLEAAVPGASPLAAPGAVTPAAPALGVDDSIRSSPRALAKALVDHSHTRASVGEPTADNDALKARLQAAGVHVPGNTRTVCFVVSADTPGTAVAQVRGFFDRHSIAFDSLPDDRLAMQSNRGGISFGNSRRSALDRDKQTTDKQTTDKQTTDKQTTDKQTTDERQNTDMEKNGERNGPGGAGGGGIANSQTTQQFTQNGNSPAANNTTNNNTITSNALGAVAEKDTALGAAAPHSPVAGAPVPSSTAPVMDMVYVAHGVTPLQVELLNASLQSDDLKQSVQRLTLLQSQVDELTKQPTAVAKGQTLTVTIPQLMRPEAGIDKTNVVKVADDGTISLPMVDNMPAAGLTTDQLEKRIAERYREKDLIPAATVSVRVGTPSSAAPVTSEAAAPATQPALSTDEAKKTKLAMAPRAATPAAPSTQPIPDVTLSDVVVIVQASKYPVPTTAPTAPFPTK